MTPATPTSPPDPAAPRHASAPPPEPAPAHGPDEADVRAAFMRAALDVTPGPVPLAAVRRAGRARRRRRTTVVSAFSVLAVATVVAAVVALTPVRPAPPVPAPVAVPPSAVPTLASATPPIQDPPPAPTPVRVVASGERVNAGKGWTVWLTEEGKHWTGPDGYENVRSVTDGNVDTAKPGVNHQSEGDATQVFHSGLYYGTRSAGRVELTSAGGRRTVATLLELPGRPGWGVWYAYTRPEDQDAGLALYDRAGKLLAELPG
ncbi:hypothetical protein [Streptomyces sp. NPDC058326]|uniref:hypothetical protein n=1 Tax=Streptomyces sp. NPDC058326 TaxID=3346447 RepID=UPI0036E142CE